MMVTSKGQVTIPVKIREELGFLPETEVEFSISGKHAIVRKVENKRSKGKSLIRHMRGRASGGLSTDEIMAMTRGE